MCDVPVATKKIVEFHSGIMQRGFFKVICIIGEEEMDGILFCVNSVESGNDGIELQ